MNNKENVEEFVRFLFSKYLNRNIFSTEEFNFHSNQIKLGVKTFDEKEIEFIRCEERFVLLKNKIISKYRKNKLSIFDIYYIEYIIKKFLYNEDTIFDYFNKYGISNKIAVMYSGHVRNACIHFEKTNLFFLSKIDPDIFIHTWNDYGFQSKNSHLENTSWLMRENKKINDFDLISKFRPKKIIIEELAKKIKTFSFEDEKVMFYYYGQAKDNASKYINSQLYSINKSNSLKVEFESKNNMKYDLSIRMRFDFILDKEISLEGLSDILYETRNNKNIIYIANPINSGHGHPGGGGGCTVCQNLFNSDSLDMNNHEHENDICDVLAISSSNNINYYSSMYFYSKEIYDNNSKNNISNIEKYNLESIKRNNTYYIVQFGDAIEKHTFCYYPEKLLNKHLKKYILLNENVFFGAIKR